jgi:hypothetical protein
MAAGLAVTAVSAIGCGGSDRPQAAPSGPPTSTAAPSSSVSPAPDPASVKANELGGVPVLMYHQLVAKPRGAYDQTPAQFRAELGRLYKEGYRTVTAGDLVAGTMDVPPGKSPMVLTFDDSTTSQYGEKPDGSLDPASALGILFAVAKRYGVQHPVATFYVNAEPFAGRDSYLAKLHALGMELGDHTYSHARLDRLDAAGVQRELARGLELIKRAAPAADVTTMALPLGQQPDNKVLAHTGRFGTTAYDFKGVMLVGAGPAPSPYSVKFKPLAVPRLLSGHDKNEPFATTYWLNRIRATRYVSDGDPEHVSFPKASAARLAPRFASIARPY